MIIALSGSMSFAKDFLEIKDKLERIGHEVIIPANSDKYANNDIKAEDKWAKLDKDVIKEYFDEIKKVDALLVVNKDKGNIQGYIGGNALIEMAFAHILGKRIYLWNEIPKMNYSDEIKAMNPAIIRSDISLLE